MPESIDNLLETANSGDAIAQYKLGRIYENGDGVVPDLETAKIWYQKSADSGYKNAETKLKILGQSQGSDFTKPVNTYQPPAPPPAVNNPFQGYPNNPVNAAQPFPFAQKSKIAVVLLAWFLGGFGAHNFYLGFTKKAIIQLILTITVIGAPFSYLWAFVEMILILVGNKPDAKGVPLK